jgi:hypothetical protein
MKKEEIGIAIFDVYSEADVKNCYESVSGFENILIVSNTKNKLPECNIKRYENQVPFATLRNYALAQFRLSGLKHFFLINSNQIVKDKNIFSDIIKTAEVFGTWCIMGPSEKVLNVEDDKHNISLTLSDKLNTEFIYIYSGIVSNIGYFDERFFNTKDLDVIDFINRMREKNVYPANNYNPVFNENIESSNSKIEKIGHKEIDDADQSVNMAYGYFLHKYKYIPNQNEPKSSSKEELLKSLEDLQNKYSKNE